MSLCHFISLNLIKILYDANSLQDNYLEEAFKMRNLLEEFNEDHGVRPPTILGVREHIFTGRFDENFIIEIVFSKVSYLLHLRIITCELQCFFFGMVYVKPRNQLCHHRPKSSRKAFEVSLVK